MKVKTKNLKPNLTLYTRQIIAQHRCPLHTSRFSLLTCCLLVSFASAELSSATQVAQTSDAPKPNSQIARLLWQSRISVPESEEDRKYKNRLQRLIEQIRSVKFESKSRTPEPVVAVAAESVPTVEPNETLSITELPEMTEEKEVELQPDNSLSYQPIADQTLRMLENQSQHPEQLHNPLGLGEILFLSSRVKQAAAFYQQALNRTNLDDTGSAQDRAWTLFQIGNCLREDDLPMAKKMYRQLITEYPNSPWTDLAKAQEELIDWYLKDKPRMLITEYGL